MLSFELMKLEELLPEVVSLSTIMGNVPIFDRTWLVSANDSI